MGTLGSRSLFHMGNAVRLAAEDARAKLRALAAEAGLPEGTNYPPAEIFKKRYGMQAGNVIGTASYVPSYKSPDPQTGLSDNVTPFWMVGGAGAEVEVDTETGACAHFAAGQRRRLRQADQSRRRARRSFPARRSCSSASRCPKRCISTAARSPMRRSPITRFPASAIFRRWRTSWSTAEQHTGPFGAKGLGESGTFGVSPAIANAIHDAVGVRITELPITAEAVLRALRAKDGRPLDDE